MDLCISIHSPQFGTSIQSTLSRANLMSQVHPLRFPSALLALGSWRMARCQGDSRFGNPFTLSWSSLSRATDISAVSACSAAVRDSEMWAAWPRAGAAAGLEFPGPQYSLPLCDVPSSLRRPSNFSLHCRRMHLDLCSLGSAWLSVQNAKSNDSIYSLC
jgi:hypothetical protein